jgi:CPA2 family monovalent cation:H+ antiporter-2
MHIDQFLATTVILLGSSVAVLLLSHRLRIPPVIGLLLTGVLVGPTGLGFISDPGTVELSAEIGVVFLLFIIGIEFSLERLRQIRRAFFLGGTLQAGLTIAAAASVAAMAGYSPGRALFFGFVVALSSTAIVLKIYSDRREMETPQGKLLTGILLYQDFLIVPMVVLTPVLAGAVKASALVVAWRFTVSLATVGLVFATARYLMPRILCRLVRTKIRELFVLGGLFICLGMALVTQRFGFSLALGAFVAGIILSESEYSPQLLADIIPFRDVFASLFFISIGMLLDLGFAIEHAPALLAAAAGMVAVKAGAAALAVRLLSFPPRIVAAVGLGVAQIGEFSFVLLKVGQEHGLVDRDLYQFFIASALLTMLVTPGLVRGADWLGARGADAGARADRLGASAGPAPTVVIVGFGTNGRNLARVLKGTHIPYRVVELNGDTVRRALGEGEPMLYGDVTRREILEQAGVPGADMVVFAISDIAAVRRSIVLARGLNPSLHIIVRTRMVTEIDELAALGADEVVAEEFETSIEIFTRVLQHLRVPRNVIRAETRILRGETYEMFRSRAPVPEVSEQVLESLSRGTEDIFRVEAGMPAAGRSIREVDLRNRSGATIIAVVRNGEPMTNPSPEVTLAAGDSLVLVGSHAELERAFDLLEKGETP